MKTYFDINEIATLRFDDGILVNKLTIVYKNGRKEVIKKLFDVGWEIEDLYNDLLRKIRINKIYG